MDVTSGGVDVMGFGKPDMQLSASPRVPGTGVGGPDSMASAIGAQMPNAEGKIACFVHGKYRSIDCLRPDENGNLVCSPGLECKVFSDTPPPGVPGGWPQPGPPGPGGVPGSGGGGNIMCA